MNVASADDEPDLRPLTRRAAFLRGVNVGSGHRIAMAELRSLAEGLGFADVSTYINSGNLVFGAPGSDHEVGQAISAALTETFGVSIDVAVRSSARLRQILDENPYPDGDPSQVTVALLMAPPPPGAAERILAVAADHEPFTVKGTEIWVNYTQGIGRSPLALRFGKVIGVSATVRNLRTMIKVAEVAMRTQL